MNSSKRGCVYGFKLQSLDLVSVAQQNLETFPKFIPIPISTKICHTDHLCRDIADIALIFIPTVTQLLDTKSTDRKMTLLHYIALIVKEKYPELANFYNELHFVDKAAAGGFIQHYEDT